MRILHSKPFSQHSSERKERLEQTSTLSVKKGGISVTQTQVAYWNYKENQKHNRISEAEEQRSHLADEAERFLHNRETERETHRHYLASETETERADKANELIKTQQLSETVRSDYANEAINRERNDETARSNRANEEINRDKVKEMRIHNRKTETNEANKLDETKRHNKRVEEYTSSDNVWSNIISALNSLSGSRVLSDMLKNSQEAPGLTQEQKDRLAAETEYWRARTEAERRGSSGSQKMWTPMTPMDVLTQYKRIIHSVAPTMADSIEQYLGGAWSWQ